MHRTTMWSRPELPGFGRPCLFGSQPGRTRPAVRPAAATPARNSRRVVMVAVLAAGRGLVIRPWSMDRVHGRDPTPGAIMAKRRATVIGAMAAATLLLASCVKFDVDVLGGDGTAGRANGAPGSTAAQNYLVSLLAGTPQTGGFWLIFVAFLLPFAPAMAFARKVFLAKQSGKK